MMPTSTTQPAITNLRFSLKHHSTQPRRPAKVRYVHSRGSVTLTCVRIPAARTSSLTLVPLYLDFSIQEENSSQPAASGRQFPRPVSSTYLHNPSQQQQEQRKKPPEPQTPEQTDA